MNNHQFKKQLFGYNKREVDQTIENLQLLIDNKDLEISKLSKEKLH